MRTEPAVIRLTGEIDIATRHEMRLAFQSARDKPLVIVDMSGLDYIDSTAIDELFKAERQARTGGGRLVVVTRNQRMVRLLSIVGLTSLVPIVETVAAAHDVLAATER